MISLTMLLKRMLRWPHKVVDANFLQLKVLFGNFLYKFRLENLEKSKDFFIMKSFFHVPLFLLSLTQRCTFDKAKLRSLIKNYKQTRLKVQINNKSEKLDTFILNII